MGRQPVIFGEVLFDRFPDGTAVLGGAPFNVAWHLRGFGLEPLMISRLGDDDSGRNALSAMNGWGLDVAGIQIDSEAPTGSVAVHLEGDTHRFEILEDRAYDRIDLEAAKEAVSSIEPALLYHGTLATRGQRSRRALGQLLEARELDVFLDVNLRTPHWRAETLPALLDRARWCKLNDDEVKTLCSAFDIAEETLEGRAAALQRRFDIELLIMTRGAAGAWARAADGETAATEPTAEIEVVDTVGAGDAFASVVIVGLLEQWPLDVTLRRAQAFASTICGVRGATVADRAFYEAHRPLW